MLKMLVSVALFVAGPAGFAQEWLKAASLSSAPKLPVTAFAQLGRFTSPSISPDGTKLAYLAAINGRQHVVIKTLAALDAKPIGLPPGENQYEYRWVEWANNDRLLVGLGSAEKRADDGFVYFTGRTRETRMISVAADGKSALNMYKPIKRSAIGTNLGVVTSSNFAITQDDVIHFTPDDPTTVLVSVIDDYADESGASVRKVNVATGAFTTVMTGRPNVGRYGADLQANVRIGWGWINSGGSSKYFYWYKMPDGSWKKFESGIVLDLETSFLGFAPDPKFAYALRTVEGRRALVKIDMTTQTVAETVYRDATADVESSFHNETGDIIGVRLAGTTRDVFFDKTWAARFAGLKKALSAYNVSTYAITDDAKFIVLRATSATEPGIYYLYNIGQKTLSEIDYDYAGLGPDNAAYRQAITYKARDGLDIEAFLTLPRGKTPKNLPTVLLPHGGPWASDSIDYDWWSQFLANRGYAVLQPNFRGSTGYGQAFMDKGNGQWGLSMQDDLTDGVAWLVKNGISDAQRMCIVGGSYGGYAAQMAAVKTPDLFKCASSLNGVSDINRMLFDDNGSLKDEYSAVLIGDRDKDRERLKATSPINGVDKIKMAIQLVHVKDDLRVDIKQSQRMRDKLQAAGKSVEYVEIAKGEHWLENEPARITYLTALENFLERNIGEKNIGAKNTGQ
jgi:dipeptidyl aminopeptidase/acylaminoacyl peptidase